MQTDYEILGVSLIGPTPLRVFHLPWDAALTVLYGPNGAGKSTLLRGLEAAVRGNGTDRGLAYLHIRISEEADPLDWEQEYFTLDLVASVTKAIHDNFLDPYGWSHTKPHGHDWIAHENLMSSDDPLDAITTAVRSQWSDTEHAEGLASAVRAARTVTLVAVGQNQWTILPSVPPAHANDAVRAVMETVGAADWEVRDRGVYFRSTRPTEDQFRIGSFHADLITLMVSDPPDWVPLPLADAGILVTSWAPKVIALGADDVDSVTQGLLLRDAPDRAKGAFSLIMDDSGGGALVEVSSEVLETSREISELANRVLSNIVPDFPTVEIQLQPVTDWIEGRVVRWVAKDRPSGTTVTLDDLSEAQRRWATLAIQVGLWARESGGPHSVMLIDEPELALHSSAAHRVAESLAELARDNHFPVIVTSHSPAFLNAADAKLIHVFRDPRGFTETQPFPETLRDDFDEGLRRLGLTRAEGLQTVRLFLVVEGEHDRIVLETLFGDRLAALRCSILVMRGTKHAMSILDSQLLVRYSDAALLVVLDGFADSAVMAAWSRARRYAASGDVDKALSAFLRSTKDARSSSDQVFRELAAGALETGRWPKLELHLLSQPDIIYYLDPTDLNDSLDSWERTDEDYRKTAFPGESVKVWLERTRGIRIGSTVVRHAVSNLDHIPADLSKILIKAEDLAKQSHAWGR